MVGVWGCWLGGKCTLTSENNSQVTWNFQEGRNSNEKYSFYLIMIQVKQVKRVKQWLKCESLRAAGEWTEKGQAYMLSGILHKSSYSLCNPCFRTFNAITASIWVGKGLISAAKVIWKEDPNGSWSLARHWQLLGSWILVPVASSFLLFPGQVERGNTANRSWFDSEEVVGRKWMAARTNITPLPSSVGCCRCIQTCKRRMYIFEKKGRGRGFSSPALQ